MKAKLIREVQRLVRDYDRKTRRRKLRIEVVPSGTPISGRNVHLLCLQGIAVPLDAECRAKVNMTDSQIEAASNAYDIIDRGIHPEDYDAYKQGLMTGYKPDGVEGDSWIHGPNWTEGCEQAYYAEREDEDDDYDE